MNFVCVGLEATALSARLRMTVRFPSLPNVRHAIEDRSPDGQDGNDLCGDDTNHALPLG